VLSWHPLLVVSLLDGKIDTSVKRLSSTTAHRRKSPSIAIPRASKEACGEIGRSDDLESYDKLKPS